jgi:hypothetical protein
VKQVKEAKVESGGEVCTDCGLRTGAGEPNCAALRDALLARDFEQPALYWRFHRMAIDAYCLQHSAYWSRQNRWRPICAAFVLPWSMPTMQRL